MMTFKPAIQTFRRRAALISIALLFMSGSVLQCSSARRPQATGAPIIETLRLSMSNAHVIVNSTGIVLVDSGGPDDSDKILSELGKLGLDPDDLRLIVLTHGHADHAGGARRLRELTGAKIVMGQGDIEMAVDGKNRPLKAQNLTAYMLRPFVDTPFPAFEPDLTMEAGANLDLQPYGLAGKIRSIPGHTPGSLCVTLDSGHVFVGDIVLGGIMGGTLFADSPGRHYFHDDAQRAESRIDELLEKGAHTFYPGHGGPIDAAKMRAWRSTE